MKSNCHRDYSSKNKCFHLNVEHLNFICLLLHMFLNYITIGETEISGRHRIEQANFGFNYTGYYHREHAINNGLNEIRINNNNKDNLNVL